MGPNGMILLIWGPCSVRHNDLYALDRSGVLGKWGAVMVPGLRHYVLYGDSIYPWRQYLRSRHGAPVGPLHVEDMAMSSCRQLIENGFGLADILFPYLSNPSAIKLMRGFPVRELYFSKMLFANFYIMLNHGQTSARFGLQPPELEVYMA
jgi:hypothetical protein